MENNVSNEAAIKKLKEAIKGYLKDTRNINSTKLNFEQALRTFVKGKGNGNSSFRRRSNYTQKALNTFFTSLSNNDIKKYVKRQGFRGNNSHIANMAEKALSSQSKKVKNNLSRRLNARNEIIYRELNAEKLNN